ncbi:dethiobiotin synthase [Hydrogenothermus marinus]|uniref:ATP-dependent dethiobiotin synthetase BioD n=1 Tax=Hydrogenothermus marinus TaxID=133270 RepID=A0A3M0C2M0_9AQUI|nr:dethiobiotin synthase [Hydrogenothermus marinus]RMA97192.1 dethiobiotin synthetase [Hydrogenothermus marinus]
MIFITGTDTGVGKTYISYLLTKALLESGKKVAYFKPVETGCISECEDAKKLSSITGQSIDEVVLYKFKNPVAPLVAEREEGLNISIDKIMDHFEYLKNKYNFVVVEGAGGIYVPITKVKGKIYTYLDLVKDLKIPVIIVARANLGTINHTVLTINALKNIKADIKAVILNKASKNPNLAEKTNPDIIKEMTNIENIIKVYENQKDFKLLPNLLE